MDPADPIDRIEPADPIDKIEPADPIDRIDPDDPTESIEPPAADPARSSCGRSFCGPAFGVLVCIGIACATAASLPSPPGRGRPAGWHHLLA
jgi:hypothetical protein